VTQPQKGITVNRTLKRAAVVLTVVGIVCLPVAAVADPQPISFNNSTTSAVNGDVFGAGHSNIVGSGDGGSGLTTGAPNTERTARIQTHFDEVTLVSHTGDAPFPEYLPYNVTAIVRYSDTSTAVYHGRNSDYDVSLSDNGQSASCSPTTRQGQCEVGYDGFGPVVTMG
jgi:hypothetical protein